MPVRLLLCSIFLPLTFTSPSAAEELAPFAAPAKPAAKPKPAPAFKKDLNYLADNGKGKWFVGGVNQGAGGEVFKLEKTDGKNSLRVIAKNCEPGTGYAGVLLSADETKAAADYVAFSCKSAGGPATLAVHLMAGKLPDAATYKVALPVTGDWQRVVLPAALFPMRPGTRFPGIGFGTDGAAGGPDVIVSDVQIGALAENPETLKNVQTVIPLKPSWRFAPEGADTGAMKKISAADYDDSAWKIIRAGFSWQAEGVAYDGWGWYRQKILAPAEAAGAPLTLTLTEIPYDDEVWFNGQRVGGLRGNYPYANLLTRTYTVPPPLIRYGETNTIAIRTWGDQKGGLAQGMNPKGVYFQAEFDPLAVTLRAAGDTGEGGAPDHFDLSDAQRGMAFEAVCRFPAALAAGKATVSYTLTDFYGQTLARGTVPLTVGKDGPARAIVSVDRELSKIIYLRGRFKIFSAVLDAQGNPLAVDARELDRFSFAKRDTLTLAPLPEKFEDTPYGKLKLVDEIDCATAVADDEHPYMNSGASHAQTRNTMGAEADVTVSEILGKKAREMRSSGAFAYRVGRGKLGVHKNYLLRVEYPEDKPRYVPMEIQNGHNFMDIGWKNGVADDDPYDNWPLSKKWEWYDAIFTLDEETTGRDGTGGASAEHGVWVYFMCRKKPGRYSERYAGGPAIARIKLYEIDVEKNAPVINFPNNAPRRTLMVDWERQADQPPEDVVRYAKLMGYNAVAPIMLKWHFMNYGEPLNGYDTTVVDELRYWIRRPAPNAASAAADNESAEDAEGEEPAAPGNVSVSGKTAAAASKPSVHLQYLAATKKHGMGYVPRIEYGGSLDLPLSARAVNSEGAFAKPNRFAQWSANLLAPATWDDLARTVDHYFKPYVKDNPQILGMLWRIRCDRMQISYGRADVELFAKETGVKIPPGLSQRELSMWAALGENSGAYETWWHQKRAAFHAKLAALLQSYRPGLALWYYNWDGDKWSLGLNDMTASTYFAKVAGARLGLVDRVYEDDYRRRRQFTGEDYVRMVRTGQLAEFPGWGREYGMRTELYQDVKGFRPFAPANWLCFADNAAYLNYFKTADGVAVSNAVSYDEASMRSINPKFECNMVTPAGPAFSMALEVLAWFHTDARTLTYTVYTYGRGFAGAHRRFAQAYLALPAVDGADVDQGDKDVKARVYSADGRTYVGLAHRGYAAKTLTVKIPKVKGSVTDLVSGEKISAQAADGGVQFTVSAGPMELRAFLIQ